MILDGWGNAEDPKVSAIALAQTPYIDGLYREYSNANLRTDGENVGLPEGQMGNSEVGHINLGAGKIVYQDLAKINLVVKNNKLGYEKTLINCFNYAKKNDRNLHLIGLVSDGGVHSHINHLKSLIDLAESYKLNNFFVHAFTDGRDVDPKSGVKFIQKIIEILEKTNGELASIIGRYFAMDRDKRWERIKKTYDLLTKGIGNGSNDLIESLKKSYQNGITDEFVEPHFKMDENGSPITRIKNGDVVLFFNFRTDRGRELTEVLSQKKILEYEMTPLDLNFVTFTNYNEKYTNINVVFDKENLTDTLGEVISKANKSQVRVAETEKYPHVTFFFNGGREEPFKGEERILCPSPKVSTYDLKPEMSAYKIQNAIIKKIEKDTPDFICLNFANPDMVGHTGNLNAAIKACETVDTCAKNVIEKALSKNYVILVIADHGNCETMINKDGTPNTAHTTNPVPIILVDSRKRKIKSGILSNIAPTILDLMELDKPESMSKSSLLI
jgi:2,3-bisphosphoglycerate-independent phosphoglycerate mutase